MGFSTDNFDFAADLITFLSCAASVTVFLRYFNPWHQYQTLADTTAELTKIWTNIMQAFPEVQAQRECRCALDCLEQHVSLDFAFIPNAALFCPSAWLSALPLKSLRQRARVLRTCFSQLMIFQQYRRQPTHEGPMNAGQSNEGVYFHAESPVIEERWERELQRLFDTLGILSCEDCRIARGELALRSPPRLLSGFFLNLRSGQLFGISFDSSGEAPPTVPTAHQNHSLDTASEVQTGTPRTHSWGGWLVSPSWEIISRRFSTRARRQFAESPNIEVPASV
ncbi:hypothetical protein CPB83DRAFT_852137 [Crepidotus variabilis]|uniref:Uncharacterized protein n=1 Tax=Crepidotus variabilis TaxID=179855 RepID=A0A9P6EIJ8_9AGAR|nr:hypothetical protein CPB83DRAFT_852137 [Crepidotus variabilis]